MPNQLLPAGTPSGLLVDGCWSPGHATFPVLDPASSRQLAQVADAGVDDGLAAVAAADEAFAQWATTPARERAEVLRAAFDLMTAEVEDCARLICLENGKAWRDAVAEATYAAEFLRWFSEEAVRIEGGFRDAPAGDKTIITDHRPLGVAYLVTPWNFPAAMATRKLAPALAAGCTTVLKPAEQTPLTALWVARVLERAGTPAGVVNVVTTSEPGPLSEAVLADRRVATLSFTGSTVVGKLLLAQASQRVLPASMELGGNAPFLVLEGANVDDAVEGAMVAKMRNGGAACTAANRFYVHASLAEAFTDRFSAALADLRVGPGIEPDTDLGAMVSLAQHVVSDVEHGSVLTRHEIFGPVAPVVGFDDTDDAIRMANDTDSGLIAYVYAPDKGAGVRVARRIEAGMVAIDRGMLSDAAAPFGGLKESALGREGGFHGIHEFLEPQYLGVSW